MIRAQHLSKRFGSKKAVDDLSFEVQPGEVLGFLGPNGAGKSTTMRMVTGYLEPTRGDVFIDGTNMLKSPVKAKAKIGYLPENAPLYTDMSVTSFLNFMAGLRGLSGKDKTRAVDKAIETCFLEPVSKQSIDTLSKGYRHRTCLAQSILHDPQVLILDEPTDGLDPNQKHEVRSLIKRMGQDKAILFSTHILEEVDAACDRAVIIDHGKIVADGTPSQLRSQGVASVIAEFKANRLEDLKVIQESLKKVKGVASVSDYKPSKNALNCSLRIKAKKGVEPTKLARELVSYFQENNLSIHHLAPQEASLESVFRSVTQR